MIKPIPVKSSNISSVWYDPATKVLGIVFHGSGLYHHADVPQDVFDAFMAAESKGKHYHAAIRGKFKHSKVDQPS